MNIFDYVIADNLIGGISKLHTDEDKGAGAVQFSFLVYTQKYEVRIHSELFGTSVEEQAAKENWLNQFALIKQQIVKLLGGSVPRRDVVHESMVNDCFNSLTNSIDQALKLCAPSSPEAANRHIERVHIDARKLKQLALHEAV